MKNDVHKFKESLFFTELSFLKKSQFLQSHIDFVHNIFIHLSYTLKNLALKINRLLDKVDININL